MDTVELLPAFRWICDECGLENFEGCMRPEMSEEDERALKVQAGIDPDKEGEFL